ncbi:MAG: hypothetical protein U0Q16_35790 [Bryobacteraceae bacterium]
MPDALDGGKVTTQPGLFQRVDVGAAILVEGSLVAAGAKRQDPVRVLYVEDNLEHAETLVWHFARARRKSI